MPVERTAGSTSLVDVLDRVLDRGLRWDTEARAALVHPPPSGKPARIVVTFVDVRTDTPRDPSPGA